MKDRLGVIASRENDSGSRRFHLRAVAQATISCGLDECEHNLSLGLWRTVFFSYLYFVSFCYNQVPYEQPFPFVCELTCIAMAPDGEDQRRKYLCSRLLLRGEVQGFTQTFLKKTTSRVVNSALAQSKPGPCQDSCPSSIYKSSSLASHVSLYVLARN